nr:extracellular ligand-binding receptor [Tanacetum cinerariifolium]
MALIVLTNLIFSTITLISNLVSRLLFSVTAYLLVIAIKGLKVPGEAMQSAMVQIGDLIKSCIEYLLEIVMEVVSGIVGLVFDLVKDGIFGSVAATGAVAGGLVEKMRSGFGGLLEEVPEMMEGAVEMVTTMVADFEGRLGKTQPQSVLSNVFVSSDFDIFVDSTLSRRKKDRSRCHGFRKKDLGGGGGGGGGGGSDVIVVGSGVGFPVAE